jgi:hypothetical protein
VEEMSYIQRVIQGWFQGRLTRQETAVMLVRGLTIDRVKELLVHTPEDILRIITDAATNPKEREKRWLAMEVPQEQLEKEKLEYLAGLSVFKMYMSQS